LVMEVWSASGQGVREVFGLEGKKKRQKHKRS